VTGPTLGVVLERLDRLHHRARKGTWPSTRINGELARLAIFQLATVCRHWRKCCNPEKTRSPGRVEGIVGARCGIRRAQKLGEGSGRDSVPAHEWFEIVAGARGLFDIINRARLPSFNSIKPPRGGDICGSAGLGGGFLFVSLAKACGAKPKAVAFLPRPDLRRSRI